MKNVRWMFVCEVKIGPKGGAGGESDGQVWDLVHVDAAFRERCTSGYSLAVRAGCAGCLPT